MRTSRTLNNDAIGGLAIFALGIFVLIYSLRLHMGTLSRMGPGYFPLILGGLLTLTGIAITATGYMQPPRQAETRHQSSFDLRAWTLICLSIASFVFLAKYAGFVPAAFAIVFVSALADRQNSWKHAAVLALAMVAMGSIIFWWALQIRMPLLNWGMS
jgi:hypothetical protein